MSFFWALCLKASDGMRTWRIDIGLNWIIPTIFAGISALSAIVAFRIVQYCGTHGKNPDTAVSVWVLAGAAIAFVCGAVLVRRVIRPFQRFVRDAEQMSVVVSTKDGEPAYEAGDEVSHFTEVLTQVRDVLGRIEARELFPSIIGESMAMRGVLREVSQVAPTDTTVLITGESGTGKELIATGIHEHSLRRGGALVKLNCVAIPEGLIESELFGHEKGSFTGAVARKKGKFELADGGTLFLDEIGDMPLNTQAKLLRVLEDKTFERVGGTNGITSDVRFIAATNKDLDEMVRKGSFRDDLLYRLNVFSLKLPALRERKEDIPLLSDYFLKSTNASSIAHEVMQYLMSYSWPGNVRELHNVIERAAVVCEQGVIQPQHLPEEISAGAFIGGRGYEESVNEWTLSLDERLHEMEKGMLTDALQKTRGVQARAAELLGINQRSFWHRVKKYEIDVQRFKRNVS